VNGGLRAAVLAASIWLVFAAAAEAQEPIPECQPQGAAQATPCLQGYWYTTPVSFSWNPNGAAPTGTNCSPWFASADTDPALLPAKVVNCTFTSPEFSGPVTATYDLSVELSSPTVSATTSRPPDANGWYNHPVDVGFKLNSFSGLAMCTADQTYAGPNTSGITVSGGCTDNAGKSASATVALRYDATPPVLSLTAVPGDRSATLRWRATTDLAPLTSLRVVRSPGLRGAPASVLAPRSGAGSYSDGHVRNRTAYRYTVTATDQAGNVAVRSVVVKPGPRLLTPASGAHVRTPPRLTWTAIPRATYYNVQIFRGGKVLSVWPKRAHLQMTRTWRFGGHRFRLRRGRYRWYVWPGFGRRSAARYGAPVGSGTFVVT
jgi:hypothetical protein